MSLRSIPVLAALAALAFAAGCGGNRVAPADLAEKERPDLAIWFSDDMDSIDPGSVVDLRRERTDAACAMASAQATLVKKPVDIIFVIDNSGSMSDEIKGVEDNINVNFADIIRKSGLDYRVIMLTHYGNYQQQRICVAPPLSKQTMNCMPPDVAVANNPPRYFHYNWDIQSNDSFRKIIDQYNRPDLDAHPAAMGNCITNGVAGPCAGWNQYLRKTAIKIFIEITDDESNMTAADIDTSILALDAAQFGTAKKRNYIVHSIIGLASNNPVTKPWLPKDPVQNGTCGFDAVNAGLRYQELSILTGGLRFPICEFGNFDGVFKEVAKGILEGTKVSCEIPLPDPPPGEEIDLETLTVEYTSSQVGVEPENFTQVFGLNECMDGAFYIFGSQIVLCPDTCSRVQRDGQAKLRVLYDCKEPLM